MEQSWPLFRYSRPFLSQIIISIVQIEKNVDGVLGFEPGATGWDKTPELWYPLGPPCKKVIVIGINKRGVGRTLKAIMLYLNQLRL